MKIYAMTSALNHVKADFAAKHRQLQQVLAKELDGYLNQLKPLIKTGVETLNTEAQKRQIPLLKEKG